MTNQPNFETTTDLTTATDNFLIQTCQSNYIPVNRGRDVRPTGVARHLLDKGLKDEGYIQQEFKRRQRWRDQRQQAYTVLCNRYRPLIISYANLVHTATVKDDVAAHLWLLFSEAVSSYHIDGDIPFAGYCKSRIKYGHWNFYKKSRRQWNRELYLSATEGEDGMDHQKWETIRDPKNEVEVLVNELAQDELGQMLKEALGSLPEKVMSLLYKMYVKEMSMAEVGRLEGCSRQNIMYLHNQAIKKLRNSIGYSAKL